jgi:4-amino-4-deoxy-L-arabinose transferase-like glycosyltransferase
VTELHQRAPRHPAFPLGVVAAGFLPWTLLVPSVAWLAVRHWRAGRRLLIVTLAWVGIIALTFTLVVRPREPHFLPIYPALALLVGWGWHVASPATRRLVMVMLSVLAALIAMIGAACGCPGRRTAEHSGICRCRCRVCPQPSW